MPAIKQLAVYTLLFIFIFVVGCNSLSTNTDDEYITKFLFFDETDTVQVDSKIENLTLTQDQIHFHFQNKITGFSETFDGEQLNTLSKGLPENSLQTIPGEFIITFMDPFDGEKWISEEGAQWFWATIKKLQEKYSIDNSQIMNRYGYAIRGFAAKLNDEQLFGLDNENLVKRISPNASLSIGI